MNKVKVKDFWKNGHLGPIHLGMSLEEVVSILGSTDYISPISRKDKRPGILKYGFMELYFHKSQRLYMIFSDDFINDSGDFKISFVREEVSEALSRDDVINLLEKIECKFEEFNDPWNEESIILRLDSGVEIGISLFESEFCKKGLHGYWLKDESLR